MDPNQRGIPIDDEEFSIELLPEDFAQYDISFKIIVIGDSSVGKSCLTTQAVRNNFIEFYQATVGFEFLTFNLRINSNVVKLQIWDTCGQEVYKSLISNFYRNCSLALIVYAINNRNTFEHAENWLNDLKNQSNPNVRVFLVGNKSDLEKERTVSKEEAEQFKEEKKLDRFMETSAKTGDNARNVMLQAAKILYKDYLKAKESLGKNMEGSSGNYIVYMDNAKIIGATELDTFSISVTTEKKCSDKKKLITNDKVDLYSYCLSEIFVSSNDTTSELVDMFSSNKITVQDLYRDSEKTDNDENGNRIYRMDKYSVLVCNQSTSGDVIIGKKNMRFNDVSCEERQEQ